MNSVFRKKLERMKLLKELLLYITTIGLDKIAASKVAVPDAITAKSHMAKTFWVVLKITLMVFDNFLNLK